MKHHSHTEAGACPFISWLSLTTLTARMDFLSEQAISVWTNNKVWSKIFFCAPFIQCLLSQKVRSLVHVFQITTALYKEQADNSYPVFDMGQPSLQNNLLREDNEMGYCGIEWKDRRRLDMKVGGKLEGTRREAVGKGLPNMAFSRELITTTRQQTVLCSTTLILTPGAQDVCTVPITATDAPGGPSPRHPVLFHLPKALSNI